MKITKDQTNCTTQEGMKGSEVGVFPVNNNLLAVVCAFGNIGEKSGHPTKINDCSMMPCTLLILYNIHRVPLNILFWCYNNKIPTVQISLPALLISQHKSYDNFG